MRSFNTAGPCEPSRNFMVPAQQRLPQARRLIEQLSYFVVHAPRQTGKTTTLRELASALTEEGRYAALYFSCEAAEPAGDDFGQAELILLEILRRAGVNQLPEQLRPPVSWPTAPSGQRIAAGLEAWARVCPRSLVLFFDEIDALRGESLRSILRQLRAGFADRPMAFPSSVVLCGLRDVREYKAASGGDSERLGTASPFNIKIASLRLGDFSEEQMRALYGEYSIESGQSFTEEALIRIFELTQGQPWLTNALAREVVEEQQLAPNLPIEAGHIDEAKERLIRARQTHLDSLSARLQEPRVRRILEPMLAGSLHVNETYEDDFQYVRDLGLISHDAPVRMANPIYREVIARVLAGSSELTISVERRRFIRADGKLEFEQLLQEFAGFWQEHGEILQAGIGYHEVAPQLVLMAFLQRVVNGGGYVDREYGVGRGRIDLLVRWPYLAANGIKEWQREAMELKVWAPSRPDPLSKGIEQLDEYLMRLGLTHGALVIFDRRAEVPTVDMRTQFEQVRTSHGFLVTVLRA